MSAEEVAARGLRPGTVAEVDGFGNVTVLQQPSTATDKPATESERSAAGYLQRMENAEAELDALAAGGYDPTNVRDHYTAGQGVALNWMATDRGQHNRQQQEDWVRAKLRRESGAVIGADE